MRTGIYRLQTGINNTGAIMKFLPNTIINFHAVYDKEWMESVFILLKKHYHLVSAKTIDEFYYNGLNLKNACHITFDDGHKSFYEIVFPLLKKHQIPVSLYVSPLMCKEGKNFWFQEIQGYDEDVFRNIIIEQNATKKFTRKGSSLGYMLKNLDIENIWKTIEIYKTKTNTPSKPACNLSIKQLDELHKSGLVDIGAHTLNHPILKNESDEVANNEISSSVFQLQDLLQNEVKYFAYPNGNPGFDFGEREITILKKCGIRLAFSTENNIIKQNNNPLAVPRNGISKGNKYFILTKLFAGKKWVYLKKMLK